MIEPMPTDACAVLGVFVATGTTLVQHGSILYHAAVLDIMLQPTLFTELHGAHAPLPSICENQCLPQIFWENVAEK